MSAPEAPAEYERARLTELDRHIQEVFSRIQAFMAGIQSQTPEQIDAFITHLQEWEGFFRGYDAAAQYLQALGRPEVAERLSTTRGDLRQTVQGLQVQSQMQREELSRIFTEMASESREHQARRAQTARDAGDEVRRIQQETADRTRKGHEQANQQWHQTMQPGAASGWSPGGQPSWAPADPTPASRAPQPPDITFTPYAPAHCHKACPVDGKWCILPPGHGGKCNCPDHHQGFW